MVKVQIRYDTLTHAQAEARHDEIVRWVSNLFGPQRVRLSNNVKRRMWSVRYDNLISEFYFKNNEQASLVALKWK